MFRFFPVVLILQVFCVYHAHKNNAEQKWYWLIIFLPAIGCIFYIYYHFYNRQNLQSVSEGFKNVINSNYEIEKLEQKLKATESNLNKSLLADKYVEIGRYNDAIQQYESSLNSTNYEQLDVVMSLLYAHYLNGDYAVAVGYGEKIEDKKEFAKSKEKVGYAWSLHHLNETGKAEKIFKEMDSSFSNYPQRLEYAKFLSAVERKEEAITFLDGLIVEFGQMSSEERRNKRSILSNINEQKRVISKELTDQS